MAYNNLQSAIQAVAIYQGDVKRYFLTHNVIFNKYLSVRHSICPHFLKSIFNSNILCLSSKNNPHVQRKKIQTASRKVLYK